MRGTPAGGRTQQGQKRRLAAGSGIGRKHTESTQPIEYREHPRGRQPGPGHQPVRTEHRKPTTGRDVEAGAGDRRAARVAESNRGSGRSRTSIAAARAPCTTNGAAASIQAEACSGGRNPSAMCMPTHPVPYPAPSPTPP